MLHLLQVVDAFQVRHDYLHVIAVVNTKFDKSVEYAVVRRDGYLFDVQVQFVGYDFCHIHEQPLSVNTAYLDGSVKEHLFVHVPFGVDDAVAETCFQFGSHMACPFVYFYMSLVVYISQDVVAGDGMAAGGELVLVNVLLADIDGLFAVKVFTHHKQ